MRKRLFVAAIAAAASCAVVFAGCAGCNGNDKRNAAAFSSNWYADTGYRYIQPTFLGEENAEVINYKVKYDASTAGNTSYKLEYSEGTYKTTFYAVDNFDKTKITEEYQSGYPEKMPTVYYYKTEFNIPTVKFILGEDSKTFGDAAGGNLSAIRETTECYFLDVNNYLRPLYSVQTIDCISPAEYQTSDINSTYKQFAQTHVTSYSYNGDNAKTEICDRLDNGKKTVKTVTELNKSDNSLIDVSGLNIAVRAMQLSGGLNQIISLYTPAAGMQDYTFTASSASLSDDERKTVTEELKKDGVNLFTEEKDGEGNVKPLETVAVTASLNADLKGVSQTYIFAAVKNSKNNTGRATMVKMSIPVNFSLGTINYVLDNVESTLWNK